MWQLAAIDVPSDNLICVLRTIDVLGSRCPYHGSRIIRTDIYVYAQMKFVVLYCLFYNTNRTRSSCVSSTFIGVSYCSRRET